MWPQSAVQAVKRSRRKKRLKRRAENAAVERARARAQGKDGSAKKRNVFDAGASGAGLASPAGESLASERDGGGYMSRDGIVHAFLAGLTPLQVFSMFDTSRSGRIDYDEFKSMLHALGVVASNARMIRVFKEIDTRNQGTIGKAEFETALYTINPLTKSVMFRPHSLVSPRDAFLMFDRDNSGTLDEDEFAVRTYAVSCASLLTPESLTTLALLS